MSLFHKVEQPPIVEWVMADGVFIKQMWMKKKGFMVPQHAHAYDHASMLAKGSVSLFKDGAFVSNLFAPKPVMIEKGVKHAFLSLEDDTLIFCIHNLHGADAVRILEEHQIIDEVM